MSLRGSQRHVASRVRSARTLVRRAARRNPRLGAAGRTGVAINSNETAGEATSGIDGSGGQPNRLNTTRVSKAPSRQAVRRRFLESHLEIDGKMILEVGALGTPLVPKAFNCTVRYLDWFSREELVASHVETGLDVDTFVNVDYVIKSKRFSATIPERFDLVIANHVVEHIPDPITWLQQLGNLTVSGGRLLMSVPDRRFTFDYLRQPSTVVQLLRAYDEDLVRADTWQVLDARFFHRPLNIRDFVEGQPSSDKLARRRFDLMGALQHARKVAADSYSNVHCFVYTPTSFAEIIDSLAEAGFISWRIEAIADTQPAMNEFHVLLRRD
jgi:SAM-dependent methyltransferase